MRANCEKCQRVLPPDEGAYICSYECTFCSDCSLHMDLSCPNCGGELVARPRRAVQQIRDRP
ncbi:DUF1272 domain-containing protein [Virgifigura deserti]|uniref:DUF1272 domain-containing protein n=1 Tax=Virgifigura deserti TaxID=2268457 RepID=UPI003CCBCBC6